ncbi:hypothetical protein EMCRGX_G023747 [Ephydatia muelleri]
MENRKMLMDIGKHCSVTSCKRLDFLPFICEKCEGVFCVEHRREREHGCLNEDAGDVRVPVCPLCQKMLLKRIHTSANDTVEEHIVSGCKDHVMPPPKKAGRCSYKNCRQSELIPFLCRECKHQFCVRHRLTNDHECSSQHLVTH